MTSESTVATRLAIQISPMMLKLAMAAIAAAAALLFAFIFYGQWDTYLRFRYGGSFGLSDPLFGVDAGFYLFRLPFYELLQSSLTRIGADHAPGCPGLLRVLRVTAVQPQRTDGGPEARRPFRICPPCSSSWSPVGDGGFTWITTNSSTPPRE